ncbi:MAG TPA: DUF4303 domain-containing protein [Paenibacillus sp.]|jgi:hypothetical protein
MEKIINEHYSSYSKDRIYGFRGVKYNVGDFYFEDMKPPKEFSEFESLYEDTVSELFDNEDELGGFSLASDFINTLVEVVKELQTSFNLLDRTEDFVSFVVDHDTDEVEHMKRMYRNEYECKG